LDNDSDLRAAISLHKRAQVGRYLVIDQCRWSTPHGNLRVNQQRRT
jgi:hypothetical protein